MKTLLFVLSVITLPWQSLFENEMGFGEDAVWAAMDISGLDVNYKQGSRAGIWGLTPEVAVAYGLRVDKWIDERYDVKKSTQAAAAYYDALLVEYEGDTLRALMVLVNTPYRQVGDKSWVTPGRCSREVSSEVLAKLEAGYNVPQTEREAMYARADSLRAIDIQNRRVEQAAAEKAAVTAKKENVSRATNGVYVVKSGDTLSRIAKLYHCTVNQLMTWNNLKTDVLQIGQKIKIKK